MCGLGPSPLGSSASPPVVQHIWEGRFQHHLIIANRDSRCCIILINGNSSVVPQTLVDQSNCIGVQVSMHCQIRKINPVLIRFQIHALARSGRKSNSSMVIQSIEIISCWVPLNSFHARPDQRFNSCDSIHVIQYMCEI